MSIQPEGEDLRKAVKWVFEEAAIRPDKAFKELVSEACLKFDLSPIEADFLAKTIRDRKKASE